MSENMESIPADKNQENVPLPEKIADQWATLGWVLGAIVVQILL